MQSDQLHVPAIFFVHVFGLRYDRSHGQEHVVRATLLSATMLDELISYPSVCSVSGAKCLPGALSSVCRTGTQKHSPELLTPFSSESTGGHRCPVMFRPEVTHEQIVHQT